MIHGDYRTGNFYTEHDNKISSWFSTGEPACHLGVIVSRGHRLD